MRNRLTLEIRTDNAAFAGDTEDRSADAMECARILREAADKLERGHRDIVLRDANGNRVGTCSLSERDGDEQ